VRAEIHGHAPSEGALAAMSWELERLASKIASCLRRSLWKARIAFAHQSSGKRWCMTKCQQFSDECLAWQCGSLVGENVGEPARSFWIADAARCQESSFEADHHVSDQPIQTGRSLTQPIWDVSSACPHRGMTGGSSEEDVSAAPKEPETHARFPQAHEHPCGSRSAQAPPS